MERNFLKLKSEKTYLVLGSLPQHSVCDLLELTINGVVLPISDAVRDLGVYLEKFLDMDGHISVLECILSFVEHCQSLKVSLSHPCPCHIASGLLQCGPCLPTTFFSLKATESPKFLTGVRQYEQVIPICLPVSKRIKYKVPMLLLIISRIFSP